MKRVMKNAECNVNKYSMTYKHTEKALVDGCPALQFVEREGFNLDSTQTIH